MITSSVIPKLERLTFYPSITKQYRFLKKMVNRFSGVYLKKYYRKGGRYWQFVSLDNGGLFAYPVMDEPVTFDNPNHHSSGVFSQEAAGICIWLIVLGICAMVAFERRQFVEMGDFSHYQMRLMEYAKEHSEWNNIARVID